MPTETINFSGAFIRASGHLTLGIGGANGVTLGADVFFEKSTRPTGSFIKIALADITLDLAGLISITTADHASGFLVITPAGIAAEFSVSLTIGSGDFSFTGDLLVQVNNTNQIVDEDFGTLGHITLPAGPYVRLMGQDVELVIAGSTSEAPSSSSRFRTRRTRP